MKKRYLIPLILILAVTLLLPSCSNKPASLSDRGQQVVSLMDEMIKSEEYAKAYASFAGTEKLLEELRSHDRSNPTAVYELSVPLENLLPASVDTDKMSDALADYLRGSTYVSFASKLQIKGGYSEALSLVSMYAAQITFTESGLKEETVYLYVFEEGYPITVSFIPGEDGAVRAIGYLILLNDFATDDEKTIEASCTASGVYGVKAKKVK